MTIGASPERLGALERVLGQTRFGPDLGETGDLVLACVRAEKAPARILDIDPAPALALPGVVRVFTAADIPGSNRLGIIPVTKDQEFLADGVIRHAGQAVALVAAESLSAARAGAKAVKLSLEDAPGVYDPWEALQAGAPLVHEGREEGNLLMERGIVKGDIDAALKDSAVVVEGVYTTEAIEHGALETEAGRAEVVDGKLTITACTQNPHYDQQDIALFLGLPKEKVRIIQAETGGGFGGKLDLSVQTFLALAAWILKRPVRMVYTREESMAATGKRHPFEMHYTTGCDESGRLTGMKVELLADTGAYASYGLAVCMRAAVHASGPYFTPNLKVRCRMAYTNNAWKGAMRGFGVPQAALAHEGQMDALARALGRDPLEIRLLNALRPGQTTGTGQVLEDGIGIVQCLEAIQPRYEAWKKELNQDGDFPQGLGLGAMFYGIGNTGVSNPSSAQIQWKPNGRVTLFTGAADIGQGSDTVLAQMAADSLGLDMEQVDLVRGDTGRTTSAGATSASRQTYISGNAVLTAAQDLKNIILAEAENILEAHQDDLELSGGAVRVAGYPDKGVSVSEIVSRLAVQGKEAKGAGQYDPTAIPLDPHTGQGSPYEVYAYAAQVVRAQVDRRSGMVKVDKVAAAHDVGKAINRQSVEGQIRGGVVMGLGMALMEEYKAGSTDNFQAYHIPTAMDAPDIEPIIIEEPAEHGPYGAKGVGEPALIPTAPAVVAAVGDALGRPFRHLPLNLERVLAAAQGRDDDPAGGDDRLCE